MKINKIITKDHAVYQNLTYDNDYDGFCKSIRDDQFLFLYDTNGNPLILAKDEVKAVKVDREDSDDRKNQCQMNERDKEDKAENTKESETPKWSDMF